MSARRRRIARSRSDCKPMSPAYPTCCTSLLPTQIDQRNPHSDVASEFHQVLSRPSKRRTIEEPSRIRRYVDCGRQANDRILSAVPKRPRVDVHLLGDGATRAAAKRLVALPLQSLCRDEGTHRGGNA